MPNTITLDVTLKITVDLDAWGRAYGQTLAGAEADARTYVPDLVWTHVHELPHIRDEHTLTLEA